MVYFALVILSLNLITGFLGWDIQKKRGENPRKGFDISFWLGIIGLMYIAFKGNSAVSMVLKKNKKVYIGAMITSLLVGVIGIGAVYVGSDIKVYNEAMRLEAAGEDMQAYNIYTTISYKDSAKRAENLRKSSIEITPLIGYETMSGDKYFFNLMTLDGEKLFEDEEISHIGAFSEGLAPVLYASTGLYGFINRAGEFVIEPQYDYADRFSGGYACVQMSDTEEFYYIDKSGKLAPWLSEEIGGYEIAETFVDGLAYVCNPDSKIKSIEEKNLVIDTTGKTVKSLPFSMYDYCISDGMIMSFDEDIGKYGAVDKEGNIVLEYEYEECLYFNSGVSPISKDGRYGVINKNGETVVDFKYDWISSFSQGVAEFIIDEKNGIIDVHGNEILPAKYWLCNPYMPGRIVAYSDYATEIYDLQGSLVLQLKRNCIISGSDREDMICRLHYSPLFSFEYPERVDIIDERGELIFSLAEKGICYASVV